MVTQGFAAAQDRCRTIGGLRGFTLLEVLVALALCTVLAAFSIPHWGTLLPTYRLRSAARQLRSEFSRIKMQAASETARLTLALNGGSKREKRPKNLTFPEPLFLLNQSPLFSVR